MKNTILIFLLFTVSLISAQVRIVNDNNNPVASLSSAFIDGSSNTAANATTNQGKGLLFPRLDLTTFTAFGGSGIGVPNNYPGYYDGLIVYNTADSGVAGVGSTDGTLSKGFWYYDNPTATGSGPNPALANAGTWRRLDGGASRVEIVNNTINNTNTTINNVAEKVVILPGTADGITTELELDDSGLTNGPLAVTKLREAKIYDNTGVELLLIASGRYDIATNTLVTGDGMVNKLLPSGTYQVELYFE